MRRARPIHLPIAALALLCVIVLPDCAAPTLPLPPPTALVEGPAADGTALVTGNARPGAFVGCLNEGTETGAMVRADPVTGDYGLRVTAEIGDSLTVWQFESTAPGGQPIYVTVPAP